MVQNLKGKAACAARQNDNFRLIRSNKLLIVPEFEPILRSNGLDSLDAICSTTQGEPLHKPGLPSWRQRRRIEVQCGASTRTFYLKRFLNAPPAARREVRQSGSEARSVAGVEWEWMNQLAREGISAVQPVAFGEEFHGRREIRSAILTAAVPGESLERWSGRWSAGDRQRIRVLLRPLARLVARLHGRGFAHRDLYLCHVFHDPAVNGDDSLRLIDLQRMIRPRHGMRRWVIKDLAALNYSAPARLVSRADRIRWLKLYLGVGTLDGSARRLVYRIAGKSLSMERRDRRRGRFGENQ